MATQTTSTAAWKIRTPPAKTTWDDPALLNNLHLSTSIPKPSPSSIPANAVLVRIRAAAINARDLMVVAHDDRYTKNNIPNLTPCADGAGEISAVGANSIWKVGDRVIIHAMGWVEDEFDDDGIEVFPDLEHIGGKGSGNVQGTLRQFAVLSDKELIKAPDYLSFEELATLSAAGPTAMSCLFFGPTPIRKGMTVLTQGTGGVSCFAIQISAAVGAKVIATSSSDAKLELAKTLGATHTINCNTHPDWENEVLRLTNGKGVDHVVEVGGSGTMEQSVACTKRGGVVSSVGFLAEGKKSDLVGPLLYGAKTLRGIFAFKKEHSLAHVKLFEEHKLHPVIGKVFEWEDAVDAFRVSMEKSVMGKVVIKV